MVGQNRFIAYAFSVGDAFIELDDELVIRQFDGAAAWLGAESEETMVGVSMLDFLAEEDRPIFRTSARILQEAVRLGPIRIRWGARPDARQPVGLYLSALPDQDGKLHAVLVSAARLGIADDQAGVPAALDLESFIGRLKEAAETRDPEGRSLLISLLRVDESALPSDKNGFMRQLAALSLDGQSAARLGDGRYALLHEARDGAHAIELMKETLADATAQPFHAATLPMAEMDLSDTDAARAVVYSIRKFADESEDFDLETLAARYKSEMAETRRRILEFRSILHERRFSLAYQPIVDLATRRVHHVEALARFDARTHTTAEMIAFAEDIGMILEFDLAVLNKVAGVLARQGGQIPRAVAVNISGRSLSAPAFTEELESFLAHGARFGERLLFEITESARIQDLEGVNAVLQRIRQAGHPVCLDDFGAGLAGYRYLRYLDVDYVKLDGSYVRNALSDAKMRAFLHSMVTLCHDLGVTTIGECVEMEEEAVLLAELEVDYGQGYLFGAPQHKLPKAMRCGPNRTQQSGPAARLRATLGG